MFPKLFPFGAGDPTSKVRLKEVSETLGFKHLLKFSCTNTKLRKYYPFAEHERLKFWAYDRIRRHRCNDQAKVFLHLNPGDANLSINELRTILTSGNIDGTNLMNRMSIIAANITGSPPYWTKRREELQSIIEQKPPPTVFFSFSMADNHWPDLHKHMPSFYNRRFYSTISFSV